MDEHLPTLRSEYGVGPAARPLREEGLPADPLDLFRDWFADARELAEPNAMVVATVSPEGQPSSRIVLLKGLDQQGFHFFTNLRSRKGEELAANARCALLFPWHGMQRQVRVEGVATPLSRAEVEAYFHARPRGAQLGAIASPQSRPISREELEERFEAAGRDYPDDVPVPEGWGGYAVAPHAFEFWQGGTNRLHDRIRYELTGAGTWAVERLAP
ncbi:pyridoxine/pyridoxamine 5'-phosphate oxidase [Nocardioides phosphati]|uniref:Pyridoxine/pyridoxamine 5'-phosphate oxidase n=1 Tax=Nocardioides phosphati TaxID=1867775 RepID=A0ABQ2N5S5_9ACTN|nr:pyridoxamine 5'-phosphate oxidase [Nocardioides phosphati]GGO83893.1 pyridoxine/pyridoxamine 5'-phosphate oxidase [Nocardioides phosphati]